TLAYLGLWGFWFDGAVAVGNRVTRFLGQAETRGHKIEHDVGHQIQRLESQTAEEVTRLGQSLQEGSVQLGRQTLSSIEGLSRVTEGELEAQIERVLLRLGIPGRARVERLTAQIDELTAKIDARLAELGHALPTELPLSSYDELTAREVVAELPTLTASQLESIRIYEVRHDQRVTILQAIDRLLRERAESR
ncbi:MAG: hypothetical protein KDD78_18690, partial [Caldilineaceae bacterium]|nr:hypothetical protein [Caldilineaceae bacterium]